MDELKPRTRNLLSSFVGLLFFIGLYLTSRYSFLLFHTLAEYFSIVIAGGVFIVAWNARKYLKNEYFVFLGIGFLLIGLIDLVHTLSYSGMGILKGYSANLPTQLWISARYAQAFTFLLAPFFIEKRIRTFVLLIIFGVAGFMLFSSIFYFKIFPVCFVEGEGLTPFKVASEYIISLTLIVSIGMLYLKRHYFDKRVYLTLVCSIILAVGSEVAFTFYIEVYGFSNLVGHFLKIGSFYLIYKAVVETGMTRPYDLLFRELKMSEDALRDSELRYRTIADFTHDWEYWADASGRLHWVSPSCHGITGYSAQEFLADSNLLKTIVHPDDRDMFIKHTLEIHTPGQRRVIDFRIVTADSRVKWISHVCQSVYSPEGEYLGIRAGNRDITSRKAVEQELERELAVNSAIAELSSTLIVRGESLNKISNLLLKHAKGITGSSDGYVSYIDEETGDNVSATLTEMMKGQCVIEGEDKRNTFPRGKDGKYPALWGHSLNTLVPFFTNSPDRHESSKGLPRNHVPITQFLSVPVVIENQVVGQISLANPERDYNDNDLNAVQRLAELYGLALQRKKAEEELTNYRDRLEELVEERTAEIMEANISLETEIEQHKETERKKIEAEEELDRQRTLSIHSDRLRSLGEMAAGIAHELNQPIVGIRGLAEHISLSIERGWNMPLTEIHGMVDLIVSQADRISHVIEHTRTFARGAASPELLPVNVNEVVDSSIGLIGTQLKSHGFTVNVEKGQDLPPVLANPFSLEEVVLNLISNSRDAYAEDEERNTPWTIDIKTSVSDDGDGKYVRIEVGDRGKGIPESIIDRVFEPFFTTKDPKKGTGLGLAISKSIVESFNGFMEIETSPGEGTTVTISIPPISEEKVRKDGG